MARAGFVLVEHPVVGRAEVPASRVKHLAPGWRVVDAAAEPKPRPGVEAEDPPTSQDPAPTPEPDGDGAEPPEEN